MARRFAVAFVAGLVGAVVALLLVAQVHAPVGPFDATLDLRLSWTGDTLVRLPPLGTMRLDTHDGPVRLVAQLDELRPDEAREIAENPAGRLRRVEDEIAADVRRLLRRLLLRSVLVAIVGGVAFALLRRPRPGAALAGALAGVVFAATAAAAAAVSWRPDALAEPRYTGLLATAPKVVGSVEDVTQRFDKYRAQLAHLVGNVAEIYRTAESLPVFEPSRATIRLLHVSDIHLNPQAWDLAAQLVEQFDVDAVVDSGDVTDWGTPPESQVVSGISRVKVPYVWVRGNHDSSGTQEAVAAQPNTIVLDRGARTVAGLRIWGIGDPRFTPDKSENVDIDEERTTADRFATTVARELRRDEPPAVDVALVHDVRIAARLGGQVPLVLAGHNDRPRRRRLGDDTTVLIQGSTGGEGLRGLEGDEVVPLTCSVLYFDPVTKRLLAYDQITVSGLGGNSARIDRHVVEQPDG